ncbi:MULTISPECIES: YciI family protein [Asticcacaulis]|uniref:YciI family protein n=1 Tax=Asticcacaulis TaxID=76890 RepID=UPI001AEA3112|nr:MULTISPECIES: YciI family protein [Asticcacaulis]MBP2158594.1 uncharacterized protein YciI [Asticcacaulis solisilvae]MDR6799640.1 uncharacterized protein YciI [Asticcacaulis sp. BE141]
MFVLSLTYKVPEAEVDKHLDAHVTWLREGYRTGMFLASGRKVPRTGGMIFAQGTRDEVEAMAKLDPFSVYGVADVEITEINLTMTAEGLEALKG